MGELIMELKNVTKYFPGVIALNDMSFQVRTGEVHGLIGENGAGKSTLIKVFTGVNQPEKGKIFIDGKEVKLSNPNVSKHYGIGCIYQELNICPDLSITDNLFINYYKKKGFLLDYTYMHKKAKEIMHSLGIDIDPHTLCGKLGIGVQQMVEIGKSILSEARLIIMDEPTSSLSNKEVDQLMKTIKILKEKGIAIIFVSHKLEEIFEICDTITVMRDGSHISTKPVAEVTNDSLIADMVGRTLDNLFPKQETTRGEEFLRIEHFNSVGVLRDVSFTAYAGEVLGFSGLVGAGRTETMRALFGADPKDSGDIYIKGKVVGMIARGAALVYTDSAPILQIGSLSVIGQGKILKIPIPIYIMIVCFIITGLILNKTAFGRQVIAVGENLEASRASGIRVSRTIIQGYILDGFFTAAAGVVFMARMNSGLPDSGSSSEFDVITAVVIGGTSLAGGTGTITGTLIGAMIVGIINNVLNFWSINYNWQSIIKGIIILIVIMVDYSLKKKQKS